MKEINKNEVMGELQTHIDGFMKLLGKLGTDSMMLKMMNGNGDVAAAFIFTTEENECRVVSTVIDVLRAKAEGDGCNMAEITGGVKTDGDGLKFNPFQ